MQITYHLSSAEEMPNIVESIIAGYKQKAIIVTVEDNEEAFELTAEMKGILDERLLEDANNYLAAEQSIIQLKSKYGV